MADAKSFVKELTTPEEVLPTVEIINILTAPRYFLARDIEESDKLPNSWYINMEKMLYAEWEHDKSNNFNIIPGPGTIVTATEDNKRTFKRGIVLNVEQGFDGSNNYYVYLFDWGHIKSFRFQHLGRLTPEFLKILPPRSFIIILAGVITFDEKLERFREDRLKIDVERRKHKLLCRSDKRFHIGRETSKYIRKWTQYHQVKLRSIKTFYGVIHYGELLGIDTKLKETREPSILADEMEKNGFTVMSPKRVEIEKRKEPSRADAVHLAQSLESIKCFEIVHRRLKRQKEKQARIILSA